MSLFPDRSQYDYITESLKYVLFVLLVVKKDILEKWERGINSAP